MVWDWPVRVFHLMLVAAFAAAWLTSGDDRYVYAHAFAGYAALLLLGFRLVWGVTGTRYALFSEFAASPRRALDYLRALLQRRAKRFVGHNPVGSWAVWLLLSLTLASGVSGMLTLGAQEQQGLLAGWSDRSTGMWIGDLHEFIAWAGTGLIAVHVLGVLVEGRLHHDNLVRAMIDGRKPGDASAAITNTHGPLAVLLLLSVAMFAAIYFRGYLNATPEKPFLPYTSTALPVDPLWQEECGSCHLAYHPSLLPEKSWQAMFAQQLDHFGEELALDDVTVTNLLRHAQANSAERGGSEAAVRISMSTPADAVPLRITGLDYWQAKHRRLDAGVWKTSAVHGKGDCGACHYDAEQATFEDAAMRIPR